MKFKKIISIFLVNIIIFTSLFSLASFADGQAFSLSADSAILLDKDTSSIIFEKNADKKQYPASLVKILTAIVVIENCNLDDDVTIDTKSPFVSGTKMYLTPGEVLSVKDLLGAMLVRSADDAATALAVHCSGSVEKFVEAMNLKALEIGTENSNFTNPTGLHDSKQVTTAKDMAHISKYAMSIPEFSEIVKKSKLLIAPTNKQSETRVYQNTNKLLWATGSKNQLRYNGSDIDIKYDLVDGIKIGSTAEAKQCIALSTISKEKSFIAVIMKVSDSKIYSDARSLIDYGMYDVKEKKLIEKDDYVYTVNLENEKKSKIDLVSESSLMTYEDRNKTLEIENEITISEEIVLPIEKNQVLGKISFFASGKFLGEVNLISGISISDKDMFVEETILLNEEKDISPLKKYGFIALKVLIVILIWRAIMTFINLKKR